MKKTQKKKIAILTGTRAEYGYIKRIIKLIEKSSKLDYELIISGTHLSKKYGLSVNEIKEDGFNHITPLYIKSDPKDPKSWSQTIGKSIIKISQVLDTIKPDIILIPGDPWIIFSCAIAATYMKIPIAHIQGGEMSGNVDGIVRHAITKLSHIHFVANNHAKKIVKQLGEEDFRIFNVGGPMIDDIISGEKINSKILLNELDFSPKKPIIIILQHPVSSEYKMAKNQIEKTLKAVKNLKVQTIIIYPNSEPNSKEIIRVIEKYRKMENVRIYPNLPRRNFLSLLKITDVLIGNSSSGIIEAPTLKTAVVNIGTRQKGRLRAKNIIDVEYDTKKIENAIKKAIYDKKFRKQVKNCTSPYGDGKSSEKIVKILEKLKIDESLLDKKLSYK